MSSFKYSAFVFALLVFVALICVYYNGSYKQIKRQIKAQKRKPKDVFGSPCSVIFRDSFGFIANPRFPYKPYEPSLNCSYFIEAPEGKIIKMEFIYMKLEDGPIQKGGNCGADSISITDSSNPDELLGGQKFCGVNTPFQPVFSKTHSVNIFFKTDDQVEYGGFVIRYSIVDKPAEVISCDFEQQQDLCFGWTQITYDNFDWAIYHGQTPSGTDTGPTNDHTFNSKKGSYLYMEASGQMEGDTAIVKTPFENIPPNEVYCFLFWYHMKGEGIGHLEVRQLDERLDTVFKAPYIVKFDGEQGDDWYPAYFNVSGSNHSSVSFAFIASRGPSFAGDISIDDVEFRKEICPDIQIRTTTTAIPTTIAETTPINTIEVTTTTTATTTAQQTTARTPRPKPKCKEDEYQCEVAGNCINREWLCDSFQDCLNSDDERNCQESNSVVQECQSSWSSWKIWKECSKTCNGGSLIKTRSCVGGAEEDCGCLGATLIEEECNTHDCIIKWNNWESWSECSVSCGGGSQSKKRNCTDPRPLACPGQSTMMKGCNTSPCPYWSEWGPWSPCIRFCESGKKTRSRFCHSGQDSECGGSSQETVECKNATIDTLGCAGPNHEWRNWSPCNASCGGGNTIRYRVCKQYFSSDVCEETIIESKECNTEECQRFQCPADFGTDPLLAVTCSDGNLDGSICNFKCPSGYIVKGAATTTCQITGRWQPNNLPFCKNICPAKNQKLANFQKRICMKPCKIDADCEDGLTCNCDAACGRTCSNPNARCNEKIFSDNLIVKCTQGAKTGTICQLSCKSGFMLAGLPKISCQSDGRWSRKTISKCRPKTPGMKCKLRRANHDKCCKKKSYDSSRQFCCRGFVLHTSYVANQCCAGKPYSNRNAICCNRKVYNKRLYGCCGGVPYRLGWDPSCCGNTLYSSFVHSCYTDESTHETKLLTKKEMKALKNKIRNEKNEDKE